MLASEEGVEPKLYYTLDDDPGYLPPCRSGEKCPKGKPEDEELYQLAPLPQAIYDRWLILRSNLFQAMTEEEKDDDFLLSCYEMCADLTERADARDDSERQFFTMIAALYPKKS